jgi:RNA polymerase sigma-70 factor (ECF subfamily)
MNNTNQNTTSPSLSFQKEDTDVFDLLFTKYYPILCAYARSFVSAEDAEEVVQDVMLWMWENRAFQKTETSLPQYLFRAVKNKCLTLINRELLKNQVKQRFASEMLDLFNDSDFYVFDELTQKVEETIELLPESYRIAFELHRFHDKTYQEIATELNVSVKTVDYRIQQALKILRVQLKDFF